MSEQGLAGGKARKCAGSLGSVLIRPGRRLVVSCLLAGACLPAAAQVQRSIVNPSFEAPNLISNGCRVYIDRTRVNGWLTTHTPYTEGTGSESCSTATAGFPGWPRANVPIIELWRTPRSNDSGGTVNAPDGAQIAELNAEVASRLYQNVCLVNGETFRWRFSHRGRSSGTAYDRANFVVGAATNIVSVATTNTGARQTPVAGAGTTGVAATPISGNETWIDYSGLYTYSGASGSTSLGFEAVGGSTAGNLLDNIQIELAPFVEFTAPSGSTPESASNNLPTLRVNGTVYTAFTVVVLVTGGTATLGTDYTTPGNSATLTIEVPAGIYDGVSSGLFPLPITVTNDIDSEPNETIQFQIQPSTTSPAQFQLRSSASCGGTAQAAFTYTIIDDDARISVVKNAAAPAPVSGQPTQFDIIYTIAVNNPSNQSASYGLTDAPGMDPDVGIVSASSSRSGGGAGGGAANLTLSGSGPWALTTGQRTLPAGQTDTYTVTVRIQVNRGGSAGNDTCAVPSASGSGLHNSVTATLQSPSGTFIGSACQNTPTPVWVTLRKRLEGRATATDQAQVRLFSGGLVAGTATTSGSASPATATTNLQVIPAGNTLQFDEAIKAGGTGPDQLPSAYAVALTCTNTASGSTTVLPSGPGTAVGNRLQWPEFSPAAGDDLDCLIVNALRSADLSIAKTNNATSVMSGMSTTYTVTVTNNGPSAVTGAVVQDTPDVGLNCPGGNVVVCTGSGCPASPNPITMNNLRTGLALGMLAASGSGNTVTLTATCTVQ